jgi:hypothetical protein
MILATFAMSFTQAPADLRFSISPNPAATTVKIVPESLFENIKVEIFSVIGNKLFDQTYKELADESISLNIAQIPDGIYLVRVSSGSHVSVKRLKIQHN